ncbi:hypothetical protein [Botrimarina sp.]|uniref:hypothetical protein n=1 Tax=Botrimarina sp. TaxID=2795802 RepID=UPI0032EBCBC5
MKTFLRTTLATLVAAGHALAQGSLTDDLDRAQQQLGQAATPVPDDVESLVAEAGERLRAGHTDAAVAALDKAASAASRSGATGRSFELSLAAAEALRAAGQPAEAARRFRDAALENPRDPRAAAAHRAACDALVPLLAAADEGFLASYDKLLAEHLDAWPGGESEEAVRRLRRRVLALAERWPELLKELRAAADAAEPELLVAAHAGLLREEPSIERFEAARADLQGMFLVGQPPAWTDNWTDASREAALVLATASLGRGEDWHAYARKLLRVAAHAPPAPDAEWRRRAAAVRVVAALASDDRQGASAAIADAGLRGTPAVAELLQATSARLAEARSPAAAAQAARRLADSLGALAGDKRAPAASQIAAAGREAEALAVAKTLAEENPADRAAQAAYARLLAESADAGKKEKALERWRQIEARDPRGTQAWYEARLARIDLLEELGRQDDAQKLVALTRLLAPPPPDSEAAERLSPL